LRFVGGPHGCRWLWRPLRRRIPFRGFSTTPPSAADAWGGGDDQRKAGSQASSRKRHRHDPLQKPPGRTEARRRGRRRWRCPTTQGGVGSRWVRSVKEKEKYALACCALDGALAGWALPLVLAGDGHEQGQLASRGCGVVADPQATASFPGRWRGDVRRAAWRRWGTVRAFVPLTRKGGGWRCGLARGHGRRAACRVVVSTRQWVGQSRGPQTMVVGGQQFFWLVLDAWGDGGRRWRTGAVRPVRPGPRPRRRRDGAKGRNEVGRAGRWRATIGAPALK